MKDRTGLPRADLPERSLDGQRIARLGKILSGRALDIDARETRERALTEWSFSRAYSEFLASQTHGFAVITSWRANDEEGNFVSRQTNDAIVSQFKGEAAGVGQGVLELIGHCREGASGGGTVDATEPSIWINGITLADARSLSDRYRQRGGFIYAGPETDGYLTLISEDGYSVRARLSPSREPTADVILQCWSEWRRRPFRFVELRHPVQNSVEGQVFQAEITDRVKALMDAGA